MAVTVYKGSRYIKKQPLFSATIESDYSVKMFSDSGDDMGITKSDFVTALTAAGVGSGWTDTTVTDADFTAADNTRYYLPAGTLSANRVVDVSGITTKVAFVIAEDAYRFRLTFTGATVYEYGGGETTDGVMGRGVSVYEIIDSKLIRTQ